MKLTLLAVYDRWRVNPVSAAAGGRQPIVGDKGLGLARAEGDRVPPPGSGAVTDVCARRDRVIPDGLGYPLAVTAKFAPACQDKAVGRIGAKAIQDAHAFEAVLSVGIRLETLKVRRHGGSGVFLLLVCVTRARHKEGSTIVVTYLDVKHQADADVVALTIVIGDGVGDAGGILSIRVRIGSQSGLLANLDPGDSPHDRDRVTVDHRSIDGKLLAQPIVGGAPTSDDAGRGEAGGSRVGKAPQKRLVFVTNDGRVATGGAVDHRAGIMNDNSDVCVLHRGRSRSGWLHRPGRGRRSDGHSVRQQSQRQQHYDRETECFRTDRHLAPFL